MDTAPINSKVTNTTTNNSVSNNNGDKPNTPPHLLPQQQLSHSQSSSAINPVPTNQQLPQRQQQLIPTTIKISASASIPKSPIPRTTTAIKTPLISSFTRKSPLLPSNNAQSPPSTPIIPQEFLSSSQPTSPNSTPQINPTHPIDRISPSNLSDQTQNIDLLGKIAPIEPLDSDSIGHLLTCPSIQPINSIQSEDTPSYTSTTLSTTSTARQSQTQPKTTTRPSTINKNSQSRLNNNSYPSSLPSPLDSYYILTTYPKPRAYRVLLIILEQIPYFAKLLQFRDGTFQNSKTNPSHFSFPLVANNIQPESIELFLRYVDHHIVHPYPVVPIPLTHHFIENLHHFDLNMLSLTPHSISLEVALLSKYLGLTLLHDMITAFLSLQQIEP